MDYTEHSDGAITVTTRICMVCGKTGIVTVPATSRPGWVAWDLGKGDFIQVALPEMSPAEREQLLTGTHGECFDRIFADDDER